MPERSDCMMTAPSTAPGIVPMPPDERGAADDRGGDDVELVLHAEVGTAALSRAVWMAALTAHSTPMSTNVNITVRRVLMPPSSAASGLPPYAYT